MAFVWGIEPEGELEINVIYRNDEYIAQIPIGYDDENDDTISVFVAISPLPTGGHEHIFCIVDADPSSTGEYVYWDGLDTRRLFNKSDRELVLRIVCTATFALLSETRPQRVHHYTHEADLPDKALRKHHIVMTVFSGLGYNVAQKEPYHGQHSWIAEMAV